MQQVKNWVSHAEFVVLFITLLGGFCLLDSKIERAHERIDRHGERTDRLYEMFIDLVRENRK